MSGCFFLKHGVDSSNACNQACPCRLPLHGPVQSAIIGAVRLVGHMSPPKNALSPSGIVTPRNTAVSRAKPTHHPKRHLDRFSRFFVSIIAVQCIVNEEENPKIAPFPFSPWDFVTLPEEDRATAKGNMHNNLVKIGRVWFLRYHPGHTDT